MVTSRRISDERPEPNPRGTPTPVPQCWSVSGLLRFCVRTPSQPWTSIGSLSRCRFAPGNGTFQNFKVWSQQGSVHEHSGLNRNRIQKNKIIPNPYEARMDHIPAMRPRVRARLVCRISPDFAECCRLRSSLVSCVSSGECSDGAEFKA